MTIMFQTFCKKGPEIEVGEGISEKCFSDNFKLKETNPMARPKIKRKGVDWKELLKDEKDFLRAAIQEVVQEVLEAAPLS